MTNPVLTRPESLPAVPEPPVGPSRPRGGQRAAYVFLLPWLAGAAVLTVGPMVASLYLSFTDYDLFDPPRWIGFENYVRMFTDDDRYWHAVAATVQYVLVSVPLKLAVALAVAMLLNKARRGTGLYRSAFYAPSLLGASVSVALVWRAMFGGGGGTVDRVLGLFGIHVGSMIDQPRYALLAVIALAVWQFGAPMVIFLAGLKQIPGELYEAAAVDGAGWWRTFRSVTLPMLSPVIFFNLVLEVIHAFQAFTAAFVVSNGTGGPANATLLYTLELWLQGFAAFKMGYASAMAWVLLAAVALLTATLFSTSRFWVHYGDGGER
jgi:multiple sugar transport system permease protein